MRVTVKETEIEFQGLASEFSTLARTIKKSKAGDIHAVNLSEVNDLPNSRSCINRIELRCSLSKISVRVIKDSVVFEFSEENKKYLYQSLSMPNDTTVGSVFTVRAVDFEPHVLSETMDVSIHIVSVKS